MEILRHYQQLRSSGQGLNSNNIEACLAMLWLCQISLKTMIRISTLPIVTWRVLEGFPFPPTPHFRNQFHRFLHRCVSTGSGVRPATPAEGTLTATLHLCCKPSLPRARRRARLTEDDSELKAPLSFMLDNRQAFFFSWNIISTSRCCEQTHPSFQGRNYLLVCLWKTMFHSFIFHKFNYEKTLRKKGRGCLIFGLCRNLRLPQRTVLRRPWHWLLHGQMM